MIDIEQIIKARIIISNELRAKMKTDLGKSYLNKNKQIENPYSRLCLIAGELDILIKVLREDDRNNK
jgi:hypothetical protein